MDGKIGLVVISLHSNPHPMKKIRYISIFAAFMTLASSCVDEGGFNPPEEQVREVIITAAQTKTLLDGGTVKWENGDKVSLVFTHPQQGASVHPFSTSLTETTRSADFTGLLPLKILSEEGGYDGTAYAVYPDDAVAEDGLPDFTLPSEQKIRTDGTFAAGLNLASAKISLADIRDDASAMATFRNALSILRFTLSEDVTSVTLTGTAPLAGKAPLEYDADGRLVIDAGGTWSGASQSVTLRPAEGSATFSGGEVNLLVWPGEHTSMTVTVESSVNGQTVKTSAQAFEFQPSKYYTLNLDSADKALIQEITESLDNMEPDLTELEMKLETLETAAEKISAIMDQIQSVALVSEYLDNVVYAPYAKPMYGILTVDIKIDYIVRPARAMELLLEVCAEEDNMSQVFSMKVNNKDSLGELTVNDIILDGDVMTVSVSPMGDWFYTTANSSASVALEISDGNTEILSDFAILVPKKGAMMGITKTSDIPVLKGGSFSMSFTYAAEDMSACSIKMENVKGFSSTPSVSANSGTGRFNANFAETDDLSQMSVDLVLTCGEESDTQTLTFADGGQFVVETSGTVDYIGGEVSVNVVTNDFGSPTSELRNAGDWLTQTYTGSNSSLTVAENTTYSQRTAYVDFSIKKGASYTYGKSVAIVQKAKGTAIDESRYHQHKSFTTLQSATAGYTSLNIVIVGDGYQKKDLLKGGKFERSARSAMEAFFGVEPYKTFRNRFRVVMGAYQSTDEGLSLEGGTQKSTYFSSFYKGSGNTFVSIPNYNLVGSVVKSDLGWSDDATYYRTIVIMLINTSEGIGSNGAVHRDAYSNTSTLGEPYASMAVAMVTANNTETSNLIRHEAGGHAFGRLGDEYPSKEWDSSVNGMHDIGWYRNVTVDRSLWNWDRFIGLEGYGDVTYYKPNNTYWCPIDHTKYNSIMYNNTNKFNAPSRQIIYERIIRQTEGSAAYSWYKFLEYDKININ